MQHFLTMATIDVAHATLSPFRFCTDHADWHPAINGNANAN
ncbi:hypothetical protein [Paraburkholderia antibiotica]|nr:hypothetical protein [Paraburkholderia antibiotica]